MTQETARCGLCKNVTDWMNSVKKSTFALKKPIGISESTGKDLPDQYEPFPSPPDADRLGRETWTFLHTLAAYYPSKPSLDHQMKTQQFFYLLPSLYPCNVCAEHLKDELQTNPPKVDSNVNLSNWLCDIHNEVNGRLGKPIFDCSKVLERWKIGVRDLLRQESLKESSLKEPVEHSHIYSSKQ
ncbi:Flavin-linked sulfhydryl oxidase of the mitochondrial IMS [Mitosporidium daphniae]|uniref:Sulfhydryl oxidase n=1 Tax=Mitosporidium daphniae TaxID=1485682 RepID=A0A098VNJ7_9MICR|nr:uncharacterized protein DI09_67p230 [Mitosporidium daphniae]KGG50535.1 hypothetical protein DI09_67p230 [Mitosporidium daphniae]|eukprot:XP_013236962.1 uncharacterized protein DI09_67p230 [Mitosporidium daphniae]